MKRSKYLIVLMLIIILSVLSCSLLSQSKKKEARIINNKGLIKVEKLDVLNSTFNENNVSITPDGKYIYFMSERKTEWSTKDTLGRRIRYDGNIWYSKKINEKWKSPESVGRNINTPRNEDEPNISPDAQIVHYQSWKDGWENDGGPYYQAELSGETWKNPVGLGGGLTEFFKTESTKNRGVTTDGSTFSPDGKTIIFAFGEEYFGNMDLYYSQLNNNGKWSYPEKLSISTPFNDRCPFLAADGKTLFFASNGYSGFGKMDIYKTVMNQDGSFGEVINIGEPFNTKEDDYGFVLTATGDEAYFIRNGDIYHADLKNASGEIKPFHTIIFSGIVRDAVTKAPLEADVIVTDPIDNHIIGISRSNAITGEYSIVLQRGKKYKQTVTKKDYNTFITEFEFKYDLNVNEMRLDVDLITPQIDLEPECSSRLRNTCFSLEINPAYPLAVGIKTELNSKNFGFAFIGMLMPNVGQYDNPRPPDNMMSDNYSTIYMLSLTYNFTTLDCSVYPFVGLFTGYRTRHWKKPLDLVNIGSGSYSDSPYGVNLGLKVFLDQNFFLEGALGVGNFAYHELISGDITRHEIKYIPWVSIAYKF